MRSNRRPMMAGNWKMYKTAAEARNFMAALLPKLEGLNLADGPDIVVCPPFTAIDAVMQSLEGNAQVFVGAQNMDHRDEGAVTGEISPAMLKDLGVKYVILGHSERRESFGETNNKVNAKVEAAMAKGLTPIVCVGESLSQRESGETDGVVASQALAAVQGIPAAKRLEMIFAYEPIWAIGTGKVCDPDEANRVIGHIRRTLGSPDIRILYGGSMKPDNVANLMEKPEIDGGLIGGASLDPGSFLALIREAMTAVVLAR